MRCWRRFAGENLPVHVMLLTARQQENDVIRGFTLGADDYMVKPSARWNWWRGSNGSPCDELAGGVPAVQPVVQAALYAMVALLGACILFLLVLLLVAMRRTGRSPRRAASAGVRPALQAALVEFLAGGTDDSFSAVTSAPTPPISPTPSCCFKPRWAAAPATASALWRWTSGWSAAGAPRARRHDVVRRRSAFANLAFAFAYEPCRRVAGDLLVEALNDSDEEVRLSACRGLVLAGDEARSSDLFASPSGPAC